MEKYGFPMTEYEYKNIREEIKKSRSGENIEKQKEMHKEFREFLKKYQSGKREKEK